MGNADLLFEAIRTGDPEAAAKLLDDDPGLLQARNERGMSAVLMACYAGRKEIRDLLLEKGAVLELGEAAAAGQLSRVRELVEQNAKAAKSFTADGFPVVALAAAFGHEEVLQYLHAKGADINAVAINGTGYTALTGAVANGHALLARWLAENGADVNYRYAKGYSPLLAAAANGQLEVVKTLLEYGADLQARMDDGKSALSLAEERGHKDVAQHLSRLGLTL
jgi:ankyrin repeat protein